MFVLIICKWKSFEEPFNLVKKWYRKKNSHVTYIKGNSTQKFGITIVSVVSCVISKQSLLILALEFFSSTIYWIFFFIKFVSAVSLTQTLSDQFAIHNIRQAKLNYLITIQNCF